MLNGLVGAMSERGIRLRTMDGLLRGATVVTAAGIVIAAVLLLVRELPLGTVAIGSFDDEQVTLSGPLFVGSVGLLAAGCGFLVAGALFARGVVAIITTVLVVLFVGWQTGALGIAGLSAAGKWLSRFPFKFGINTLTWPVRSGSSLQVQEER